uniref:Uncharacterized protein n=1 Tax=Anopheles atroparvus TaxID=41427 RepID=A0A182JE16_ANOAO
MELTDSTGELDNITGQVVLLATRGVDRTILFVDLCAMYCRLCLERTHEASQLDDALLGTITIREAIESTVGILTEINSLAPTIVCRNCMPKLKFALAFRHGCASSDEQMKRALEALDGLQQDALICVDGENGLGSTFTETLEMLRDFPIELEDAIDEKKERAPSTEDGSWEFEIKDHDLVDKVAEHGEEIELIEEYLDSEDGFFEPSRACDLEDHLSTHILLLPFTCFDCHTEQFPMVFSTLVALNRHLQSHLFPYRCPECPKRFLKPRSMENHITQKHREEINPAGYGCERCGASFERCHQLQRHMRAHEIEDSGRFRCEYCQRAFGTGTCLRRHRRIHTGDKPYACKYCGKRFNHEHNFANHKRLHVGERIHVCEVCHKSYTTGTGLRLHLADHFPDDPRYGPRQKNGQLKRTPARYPETLNTSSLEGIAITTAPESSSRIYQCTAVADCRFTTENYNRIFYHRQTHIKRFECDHCGKRFTIRSSLAKHVARVHDKAHTAAEHRTHLCSQCGKTFSTRQKFQRHIDSHRGNKQYRWRFCEKEFVQKANCKAHERIHTEENPCSILAPAPETTRGGHRRSTHGSCG